MQRRLALAFAATALAAVVLVGFGTLLLAQRGARQAATEQLVDEMEAITALAVGTRDFREFSSGLLRSRQAFDFDSLQMVVVTGDNQLVIPDESRLGRGRPFTFIPVETTSGLPTELAPDQRTRLDRNEFVVFDADNQVLALRRFDIRFRQGAPDVGSFALMGARNVEPLPRQAVAWFLVSGLAVVSGAIAAGIWLARRLVRPIHALQTTTATLAAGNLEARTAIDGDDELADLGRSVNQMAGELQRSKQLDQQFLMSISHDLRTPLTAIEGYGEALVDGTADDGTEVGRIIVGQAQRLERLVQDLMDLARLDANQFTLDLQPVDVAVLAGRTVAALQNATDEVAVSFVRQSPDPLVVNGDPDRLTQVMTNLIDNGAKFAASSVTVTTGRDDRWATVTVTDDGPGISEADRPYVFDRLYIGKAQPVRAENSSGLGLAIVNELVGAMGGVVGVAPGPDGGTEFTVRLPLVERN